MQIINLKQTPQDEVIAAAVAVLKRGGLIIFPTETTYGAGVDAMNQAAVDKLLAYKARREGKPLSIAVTNPEMANHYVEVNDAAAQIYQRFLPGPVTVVSKTRHRVATGVESEFDTLGIRMPDYPLVHELVKALTRPITATSANASGERRPYTIDDIFAGLSEKQKNLIDLILDAGELPHNPPSTVIDTTLSTPVVFRQGEINLLDNPEISTFTSASEQETKDLAKRLLLKYWNTIKAEGLVIGLNGSLGTGKTIFAKGAAEFLQITDTITSPTYTYVEEYPFNRHGVSGQFYHLDVWKVEKPEELVRLGLPQFLGPNKVVIIEWVSQVAGELVTWLKKYSIKYLELTLHETTTGREIILHE